MNMNMNYPIRLMDSFVRGSLDFSLGESDTVLEDISWIRKRYAELTEKAIHSTRASVQARSEWLESYIDDLKTGARYS